MHAERRVRVGIAGVSGYTGLELLRYLVRHPGLELVAASSERQAGEPLGALWPNAQGRLAQLELVDLAGLKGQRPEAVFLCLPHSQSAVPAAQFLESGARVIDLSADFRLPDAELYGKWYGAHPRSELLGQAVYGLPEEFREEIRRAKLVANPGCYPTAALLALIPLLRTGLVEAEGIVIDAKSGLSGAGKTPKPHLHFVEANENATPYSPGRQHRHVPEIDWYLSQAAEREVQVTFVPHLLPMDRGILESAYVRLAGKASVKDVENCWRSAYAREPFIRILGDGLPSTKRVAHTNLCELAVREGSEGTAILFAAIDNLGKGASGQALQNLNIMYGLDETTALW